MVFMLHETIILGWGCHTVQKILDMSEILYKVLQCPEVLEHCPEFYNFRIKILKWHEMDMKLVCLLPLVGWKLFFGLHPRTSDNFILSAPPKKYLAGTPMSVGNSAYSDMVTLFLSLFLFLNTVLIIL